MSDPLSIAASIAGIVSLSAAVFQQVTKFAKEAKGAEKNVKELASQTRNLSGVLQNLALLASSLEDQDSATTFRAHHLYACSNTLYKVEERLKKAEDDFQTGSKAKAVLRMLKWPFSADETKSLIADMATHSSTLELALSAETLEKLLQCLESQDEIKAGLELLSRKVDRINEIQSRVHLDDRRRKVVDFFLKVNPQPNFQTAMRLRQPLTGLWLTESNQTYLKWRDIPGSSLWLSGIPGAGKTVLCGVVIDEVLQWSNESTAVAFHFCDYKNQESQRLVNILCSIAVQLSLQNEDAFSLLEIQFALLNPNGGLPREPEVDMLLDLIPRLSSLYEKVFLVIDGLDECGASMGEVAAELRQLSEGCRPLSLAIFSRDEQEINEELSESFAHIEIAAHTKDIDLYVCAEMSKRRQLKRLRLQSPDLAEEIREKLVNGAQGMFRWVTCQLDYLCELTTNRARRDALSSLPPTLPETYHRMLLRILKAGPEIVHLVRKSLHWISLDRRLSLNTLRQAVSIPDSIDSDFNNDDLIDADRIVEECRSFVRRRRSSDEDIATDYIELAHFTVEEYLESIDPDSDVGIFRFDAETVVIELSMTCLRSILMTKICFDDTNLGKIETLKYITGVFFSNPFYYFAVSVLCWRSFNNVGQHNTIWTHIETSVLFEALSALFGPQKSLSFVTLAFGALVSMDTGYDLTVSRLSPSNDFELDENSGFDELLQILDMVLSDAFTPVKFAASLGLPHLWSTLFEKPKFGFYQTIQSHLCCAMEGPAIFLRKGKSAIHGYSIRGKLREKTVDLMLKFDIAPESTIETIPEWPQLKWMCPLSSAIQGSYDTIVESLLQNGVRLSSQQTEELQRICETPERIPKGILRALAENQSPATAGLGIDRWVIERSNEEKTAGDAAWETVLSPSVYLLSRAIISNDVQLCERLFASGISVDSDIPLCAECPDRPLFLVIKKWGPYIPVNMAKILDFIVEQAALDDSQCNNHSLGLRNAVCLAIWQEVPQTSLNIMLDASLLQGVLFLDSDLNPFHVAALANNLSALHSLRVHMKENFPAYRKLYRHFSWTKQTSCEKFLAASLSRVSRYSTKMNNGWPLGMKYSGTPLHYAIGHKKLVDFFIDCGADLNVLDGSKRTPLILAALYGDVAAVRRLLAAGADTHIRDGVGRTALSWACQNGNLEIIEMLMPKELNLTYSHWGFTGFHDIQLCASKAPELFVYLWSKGLDYLYRPNPKEVSAVTFAFERGGIKMKTLILNSGLLLKVEIGDPGNPLTDAVIFGRSNMLKGVLRLFARSGMIENYLNRGTYPRHTPLCMAAFEDRGECISELLNHGADINYECCFKGSPLMGATTFGRLKATKELVRNGASISYTNSEGVYRNAFEAGKHHSHIRKWFLIDRFRDQDKLAAEPHWSDEGNLVVKEWAGIIKAEWRLTGKYRRRHDESRFDYLCAIQNMKERARGRVIVQDVATFAMRSRSAINNISGDAI